MLTKDELLRSISEGNLDPKILQKFFEDMKITAFTYDYKIQRDLINYYETEFDIDFSKSMLAENLFGPNQYCRILQFSASHQFIVPGEMEHYKRSDLFDVYLDPDQITENIRFFQYNLLVFVDNELFTNYKLRAYRERVDLVFDTKDLNALVRRHNPHVKYITDMPAKIRVLFLPNALITSSSEFTAATVNGKNIEGKIFPNINRFRGIKKFFGFWINKETGAHFMVPSIEYDAKDNFFTMPDTLPTYLDRYELVVVGMNDVKSVLDVDGETEWIKFSEEKMPLPKSNIVILLKEENGDTYLPNDGTVELKEYYPNIYQIINPNKRTLRLIALYEEGSQNAHIQYDDELKYYLSKIDLYNQYKNGNVPTLISEYKPVEWKYGFTDFFSETPYTSLDLKDQWDSFIYKMETIAGIMKHWYHFYEEYQRRTYGFLSGWYHNVKNYARFFEKIRYRTDEDLPDEIAKETFREPQYLFTYKNNAEYGDANSYCFFVDGKFTIPTRIIVYRNLQYVYFPVRVINPDSIIEVERFDGVQFRKTYTIPEEGIEIPFSKLSSVGTLANCIFLVATDGTYLNDDDIETHVLDPGVGDTVVSLETSVYKISPEMTLKFVPKKEELVDADIMICCNNKTYQYVAREVGIEFTIGNGPYVNLNFYDYIGRVKRTLIPRLRIFTSDGRLVPKRNYTVYQHKNYFDKPKFNIPIRAGEEENFRVCYIGYDERLIYHRDDLPKNGLISLEGRTNRPLNLSYHDIYLDGFRLTKYDIEQVSPFKFIITNYQKYDTTAVLEIYEKGHPDDSYVKFTYNETSEYIMDKMMNDVEKLIDDSDVTGGDIEDKDGLSFKEVIEKLLDEYEPTGNVPSVDSVHDDYFELVTFYIMYRYLNGDRRLDLEAFHHVFDENGRVCLNADDRIRYAKFVRSLYYFCHDWMIDRYGGDPARYPKLPDRELAESSIIPDDSISVDEREYSENGYPKEDFDPVYDEPFIPEDYTVIRTVPDADADPNVDKYIPSDGYPHSDDTDRYSYKDPVVIPDPPPVYTITSQDTYRMDNIYATNYATMTQLPDDFSIDPDLKLTNTSYMYAGCTKLLEAAEIDMSEVVEAKGMFDGCEHLIEPPVGFDISKVEDCSDMFRECHNINEWILGHLDLSAAKNCDRMFYECRGLTGMPLLTLGYLKSADSMFYGCMNITDPVTIDCSKITTIDALRNMFEGSGVKVVYLVNVVNEFVSNLVTTKLLGSNIREVYMDGVLVQD